MRSETTKEEGTKNLVENLGISEERQEELMKEMFDWLKDRDELNDIDAMVKIAAISKSIPEAIFLTNGVSRYIFTLSRMM